MSPYEIIKWFGVCGYQLLLPVELSRIHDVLLVSNLEKYMAYPSHILKASNLDVREKISYSELPLRIIYWKE